MLVGGGNKRISDQYFKIRYGKVPTIFLVRLSQDLKNYSQPLQELARDDKMIWDPLQEFKHGLNVYISLALSSPSFSMCF